MGSTTVTGTGGEQDDLSYLSDPNLPLGPTQPTKPQPMQPEQPAQPMAESAPQSQFQWQTDDKQPFPAEWDQFVIQAAEQYQIDPNILASLLANETGHVWDPNLEGDQGTTFGLGQINIQDFAQSAGFNTAEEYKEALRDPAFAISEAARVLRHKIDTVGGGDPFLGLVRYNGAGPNALRYATDAFNRVGYPVPPGY